MMSTPIDNGICSKISHSMIHCTHIHVLMYMLRSSSKTTTRLCLKASYQKLLLMLLALYKVIEKGLSTCFWLFLRILCLYSSANRKRVSVKLCYRKYAYKKEQVTNPITEEERPFVFFTKQTLQIFCIPHLHNEMWRIILFSKLWFLVCVYSAKV